MMKVIVVGGGYAGVTAAAEIERLDPEARVTLLEATERLGGRTHSVPVPGPAGQEIATDLGAHYFGVKQRRVDALARRLLRPDQVFSHVPVYGPDPAFRGHLDGAWRFSTRSSSFLHIQGLSKRAPIEHKVKVFQSLCRYLLLESLVDRDRPWRTPFARRLDTRTVQDWIDGQSVPEWIRDMWGLATLDIMSVHASDLSLLYWLWYNATNAGFLDVANDFTGGPQEFSVDCGLGGLLERYAAELRGEVRLGTPVVGIDHGSPGSVTLTTAGGEQVEADHVIVAVTPAAAARIRFTPKLQPARHHMHAQPTGHAVKAVFFYDEPFWWDSAGGHFLGFSAGPHAKGIEWALDSSHPSGAHYSLMAWVSDQLVDAEQGDGFEAALADAMVALTGDPRARQFTHVEWYDWRADPFVGGGPDTIMGPGVLSELDGVFAEPERPHGRLWFAGAECALEFPGYVEGAMASGESVAARITGQPQARRRRGPQWAKVVVFALSTALLTPAGWLADGWARLRGGDRDLGGHMPAAGPDA